MTIPLSGLRFFKIPFPTQAEQNMIVRLIDEAFARVDTVMVDVNRASTLIDHVDNALLLKAFQGGLVGSS